MKRFTAEACGKAHREILQTTGIRAERRATRHNRPGSTLRSLCISAVNHARTPGSRNDRPRPATAAHRPEDHRGAAEQAETAPAVDATHGTLPSTGAKVTGLRRRGKWIIVDLDTPYLNGSAGDHAILSVHLGMTGQFTVVNDGRTGTRSPSPRLLRSTTATELRFRDPRRFGSVGY